MKIIEKIFDVVTGEETVIERDCTPEEVAAIEKAQAEAAKIAQAAAAAAATRAALLAKLGITEDEAKLLLS